MDQSADIRTILYISIVTLPLAQMKAELIEIVNVSKARNVNLSITGALLSTGRHFAQFLEGPGSNVDTLMASISRDNRHRNIEMLLVENVHHRRFKGWSLAYGEPTIYLDEHLKATHGRLRGDQRSLLPEQVMDIMQQFID